MNHLEKAWVEKDNGILFSLDDNVSECVKDRLDMLVISGIAIQQEGTNVFLPSESIVTMSNQDCELLGIPDVNPYQFYVRASGDLGHNDLKYFVEILQSNGTPFVNPVFRGAFVHLNSDTTYRLSLDQYQLLCIAGESNRSLSSLERSKIAGYNLINLSKIQSHAKKSSARLDNVLSDNNNKVVIPDKLDIQFKKLENGEIHVEPIILQQDDSGQVQPVDTNDGFQQVFTKNPRVQSVYRGKDRTKFVCTPDVQEGLKKIKAIKKLSPDEKERFEQQPRELFPDEVFHFSNKDDKGDKSEDIEDWLPTEGDFIDKTYSDRVRGTVAIQRKAYFGSGHSIDWLNMEGAENTPTDDNAIEQSMNPGVNDTDETPPDESNDFHDSPEHNTSTSNLEMDSNEAQLTGKQFKDEKEKKDLMALDIKENFEAIDYDPSCIVRHGNLDNSALKDGISLMDYQQEGISWMFREWQRGFNGVLLADDMGLGKTLQTLAFISSLKKGTETYPGIGKPVLIVAPIALQKNWMNEYGKFINTGIYRGIFPLHGSSLQQYETGSVSPNGKRKLELKVSANTISMTTYETLRDYQFSFAEVDWGIIIVDEAQKMKNPSTGVTKAIKAMKHDYTICLSGTPVENSWVDLWSIMDFVQPAKLGDLKNFKESYISKLGHLNGDITQIETLGKELKNKLAPLFLRRMKKDKLEGIPKKTVHRRIGQMPDYQKRCYVSVIDAARNQEMHPLMMIAKLRDISLHPDIGSKQVNYFYELPPDEVINKSARLIQLFEILNEIKSRDEKALVFLVSKKMQLILKHLIFEKFGIKVHNPVNGEMNGVARQRVIDEFNSTTGFNVLILSPEAAGVGFTITSANNVIHLSRTWNPAKEDQATDRVYRIGQKKDVNVYLPMSSHTDFGKGGSFDEKLDELLSYKRRLSENVLFPTGDSQKDGMQMFHDLTNTTTGNSSAYLWTMEDIDQVIGDVFEEIVLDLYNAMDGWSAYKTPHSNDYGVDVVVLSDDKKKGLLIQCKHKDNPNQPVGVGGVQEVAAAIQYYKKEYKSTTLEPILLTNSNDFTAQAKKLAHSNNVTLISRIKLNQMLAKNPIVKRL